MKYIFLIIFLFTQFFETNSLIFIKSIGLFQSASSFDIDLNGNFYVSDIEENNIVKLDSLGNEIVSIGGYGWSESSFDRPVSIITNTLSVYVADENNDRVQRFDKDLNFLSLYSGSSENSAVEFAYPISVEISNIGDLYILESDNNRILKFNLTGEFLTELGGNDAGSFALSNPIDFSIDRRNDVYVLDESSIKVFDQFGNGKIKFDLNFVPQKIELYNNEVILIEENRISFYNPSKQRITKEFKELFDANEQKIIDAIRINDFLYVLTSKKIAKFKLNF